MYKLLTIFGSLVKRPLIACDFDANYEIMLKTYDSELDKSKQIFDRHIKETETLGYAPVHSYQPPVAGQLEWARELRLRISQSMERLKIIDHPCMLTEYIGWIIGWRKGCSKLMEIGRVVVPRDCW